MSYKDVKLMTDKQLTDERSIIARDYQKAVSSAKILHSRLNKIKHELRLRRSVEGHLFVSDHALVRYLERIQGLNVESLREQIASKITPQMLKQKQREYTIDGVEYALSEDFRCITTIKLQAEKASKTDT